MVGISTSYFAAKGFSIYESVKRAHKLGFRLIELGANHRFEDNVFETLKKIKKNFPKVNFSLHAYFPPIFEVPTNVNAAYGLTPENKRIIESMTQGAKILSAKIISFHSGFNHHYQFAGFYRDFKGFKEFKPVGDIEEEVAYQNQKNFFKYAVEKAEEEKVSVLMEVLYSSYMGQQTLSTIADYFDFLEAVPGLGFLLDYAHTFIEFENPDKFFKLKETIEEIHLSDVKKGEDHYVLGEGEVDLENLFKRIKKRSPIPPIILEHAGGVKEEEILREKKMVEKFLI